MLAFIFPSFRLFFPTPRLLRRVSTPTPLYIIKKGKGKSRFFRKNFEILSIFFPRAKK